MDIHTLLDNRIYYGRKNLYGIWAAIRANEVPVMETDIPIGNYRLCGQAFGNI